MGESSKEKNRRIWARRKQRYAAKPELMEKELARQRAWRRRNKDKINARERHRYATDPEYRAAKLVSSGKNRREKNLKRKYGISLEGYSAMLARQSGVCAICLKEEVNKSLCVDHDHKTRMLRDLLCDACNKGLGHYRDDSALMRRGADYLDYWQACHEEALKAGRPSATAGSAHPPEVPIHQYPRRKRRRHDTDRRNDRSGQGRRIDPPRDPTRAAPAARSRPAARRQQAAADRAQLPRQGRPGRHDRDQGSVRPRRRQDAAGPVRGRSKRKR